MIQSNFCGANSDMDNNKASMQIFHEFQFKM